MRLEQNATVLLALTACAPASAPAFEPSASVATVPARPSTTPIEVTTCELTPKLLRDARWSPDGAFLLTMGQGIGPEGEAPIKDGSVDAWDLRRGERRWSFDFTAVPPDLPLSTIMTFSRDGTKAYASGWYQSVNTRVVEWDLERGRTRVSEASIPMPTEIALSGDGTRLVTAGLAQQLLVVELPSLRVVAEDPASPGHAVGGVWLAAADAVALHWAHGSSAEIVDTRTGAKRGAIAGALAVSPDGARVATYERGPALVDPRSGAALRRLAGLPSSASPGEVHAAFSPDGARVAFLRDSDGSLAIFEVASGKLRATSRQADRAGPLVFSPDGAVLWVADEIVDATTLARTMIHRGIPTWSTSLGHTVLLERDEAWTEIDALTGAATGRRWTLPGYLGEGERVSPDRRFFSYAVQEQGALRVVRLGDGAVIDLAVGASSNGEQQGWALSPEGRFEGPALAKRCVELTTGAKVDETPGMLAQFFR